MSTYQGPWCSRHLLPLRRSVCGTWPWPPSRWSQASRQIWTSQQWQNRLWLKEQTWLQSCIKIEMESRWDEEEKNQGEDQEMEEKRGEGGQVTKVVWERGCPGHGCVTLVCMVFVYNKEVPCVSPPLPSPCSLCSPCSTYYFYSINIY